MVRANLSGQSDQPLIEPEPTSDIDSTSHRDANPPSEPPPEASDSPGDPGTPENPPDPFDPESLRLSQDFSATLGVKKVLTTVRCRKPNRQEFVRVRPGKEWRLETACLEDQIQRETYLVAPGLWSEIPDEIRPICLYLTCNRQSDVFLWPCKLPGPDGKSNDWYDSALAAAQLAQTAWIRVAANMQAGCYDTYQAAGDLADPEWPSLTFQEILKLTFKGRFIDRADHPIIRQLRGEV